MRVPVLLVSIAVSCTAASVSAIGACGAAGQHAKHDPAGHAGNTESRIVATGSVRADENGTSFRLLPDGDGDAYLLITPETAEPTLPIADLAGKRVRVIGTVVEQNGTRMLRPASIIEEHDHSQAPHDGVVGMAGDRHLELVVTTSGEIQIYLLDAFMSVADARGVTGDVVIQTQDRATRSAPLRAGPARGLLVVEGERRRPEDDNLTATLTIGAEQVRMTLPFRPEAPPHSHDHHAH